MTDSERAAVVRTVADYFDSWFEGDPERMARVLHPSLAKRRIADAGTDFGFRVGTAPSRKLNLYTPAAMVGYFDELSAAITRGEADSDALTDIAKRYGMEVIGPVPEGYL